MARFDVKTTFRAEDKITDPVKKMQARIKRLERETVHAFRKMGMAAQRMNQNIRQMGMAGVAGATSLGFAMQKTLAVGVQLEDKVAAATARFSTDMHRGTTEFKAVNAEILNVAETSRFTANEVAGAMNVLASTGQDSASAMNSLGFAAKFATAAGLDMSEATTILTDSMGALDKATDIPEEFAKNMVDVGDLIVGTANASQTGIVEMFEAFKQGAPAGIAAGQDMQSIAAMTGLFARAGIKATKAGTALKNIFLSMSAPGSEAATIMKKLKVETANSDGTFRKSTEVFKDFAKALNEKLPTEQVPILKAIFQKIPLASAINLVRNVEKFELLDEVVRNLDGSTEKVANLMSDTVLHVLKLLRSAVDGVTNSIFMMNRDGIKKAVEGLTQWVIASKEAATQKIGGFIKWLVDNRESIAETALNLGKTAVALTTMGVAMKGLAMASELRAFLKTGSKIARVTSWIAALIAAIIAATIWVDQLNQKFLDGDAATRIWLAIPVLIVNVLGFIGKMAKALFGLLVDSFHKANELLNFVFGPMNALFDKFLIWSGAMEPRVAGSGSAARPTTGGLIGPSERVADSITARNAIGELRIIGDNENMELVAPPSLSNLISLHSTGGLE